MQLQAHQRTPVLLMDKKAACTSARTRRQAPGPGGREPQAEAGGDGEGQKPSPGHR